MAAAETARLIASLELQDKNFTRGIRNVERGVGRVDKKLSAFGGFVNRNLARGIDRAAASLVDGVFAGVESLKELEQQQAQTNAVIKSTGSIAGVSGDEVTRLAEKYEGLNAIVGDEVIRGGENLLLTFTNIRKDAFEPTLEAALDMNTALGKGPEGLTTTVMQVAKAINDPTKGLTKLQRAGVNFTKGQIKQIKALQKSGDLLGAQKIILAELNREFGGSFAAQGDTTAGKVAKFNDAVEDLQRTFAKALLPIISKVADKLGTFLGDPAVVAAIEDAGVALGEAFDGILTAAEKVNWGAIAGALRSAAGFAGDLVGWFGKFPDWAQALIVGGFVATRLPIIGGLVSELGKGLIKGVLGMTAGVVHLKAATVVGAPGAPIPGGQGGLFSSITTGLKGIVTDFGVAVAGLGLTGAAGLTIAAITPVAAIALTEALIGLTGKSSSQREFEGRVETAVRRGLQPKNVPPAGTRVPAQGLPGDWFKEWLERNAPTGVPRGNPGEVRRDAGALLKGVNDVSPPIVSKLGEVSSSIVTAIKTKPLAPKTPPLFNPTVRLDPSQVIDIRRQAGDRPSPGNPGRINEEIVKRQAATKAAIDNAKSIASRENSAQKTAIDNAKNAAATAGRNTTSAANRTTSAARQAGLTTANAMTNAANRIVTAVNGLDLSVNVTTVNRTSTVNNRYGPSGGSSTTQRAYGPTG